MLRRIPVPCYQRYLAAQSRDSRVYCCLGAADFKLCLSVDMSSRPCTIENYGDIPGNYVKTYHADPQQPLVNGRALVSTFIGEDCSDEGWVNILRDSAQVYFIPTSLVDPRLLSGLQFHRRRVQLELCVANGCECSIHGQVSPTSAENRTWTVFVHDSYITTTPIRKTVNWFWAKWWEMLDSRAAIDFVAVISRNNYGKSHHIGLSKQNSQA